MSRAAHAPGAEEEALHWLNDNRPEGEPEATHAPSAARAADTLDLIFDEQVRRWSG